jgi:hypothetical protein
MEIYSLSRMERPEGGDGPEIISRLRHHHQAFAFHLGGHALGAP